jgi:hypothetical protein
MAIDTIKEISGLTWMDVSKLAVNFAICCFEDNTLEELNEDHRPCMADITDLSNWGITQEEWSWAIETARVARESDTSILSTGQISW